MPSALKSHPIGLMRTGVDEIAFGPILQKVEFVVDGAVEETEGIIPVAGKTQQVIGVIRRFGDADHYPVPIAARAIVRRGGYLQVVVGEFPSRAAPAVVAVRILSKHHELVVDNVEF